MPVPATRAFGARSACTRFRATSSAGQCPSTKPCTVWEPPSSCRRTPLPPLGVLLCYAHRPRCMHDTAAHSCRGTEVSM
jgi:hypothetical protein